ncbi:MAG TPA: penicillin-binding protein 2, partial [Gaiellaceae bacterium]|nr:penicillin-binding protein 2 [Gaiellaceae bacterium]
MSERASNRRIRLLLGLFALVFAGTLGRAIWLQGVQASTLERIAARQHEQTTEIPAGRGTIYDRAGEPLAIGEQATTVYADPRLVRNPRRVALAAAEALGVDAEALYPLLADRKRHFVYIKRKADPAKAAELEKQNFVGVGYYPEELRYYPQRGVAAHVLGFAGVDNDGLDGLERSLDKQLIGRPGSQTTVTDPAGRVIDVVATKPERAGDDVFLTIDHGIQAHAESVLRATVKRWGAKAGNAIVLDPRTGAVLAMAVAPGYDANRFASASADRRRNRSVTDVYEPGSTFKVVTVAAALSEKIVAPSTAFTLPSSIRVADRIINEHEPRATQRMTVAQILSQSSNVGTITLAQMLGRSRVET